jgi:hypothetical protein
MIRIHYIFNTAVSSPECTTVKREFKLWAGLRTGGAEDSSA